MRKGTILVLAALIATVWAVIETVRYLFAHWGQLVVLNPAGPVAFGERSVMVLTLLASGIVVVPIFFMLFFF
ncbi:MAG TPA: hypothetical protein VN495_01475, partial [Candidatus Paceibacterota bacterium]|nr:hypothetical protein [Candidatus Paceibacterota bacterium]